MLHGVVADGCYADVMLAVRHQSANRVMDRVDGVTPYSLRHCLVAATIHPARLNPILGALSYGRRRAETDVNRHRR